MTLDQIKAELILARAELDACYRVAPQNYEEIGQLRNRYDIAMVKVEGLNRQCETYNLEITISNLEKQQALLMDPAE